MNKNEIEDVVKKKGEKRRTREKIKNLRTPFALA